ncbi:transporter substrate-binding domain-containing protein [Acinetobacter sp. B5B]|uniref:transporter substrate-binding domain-containing protein n=1 Tax=Acinetobacter baretiae TaxID=2605383 RepID=UPI0018C2B364|nr:transporter substrate-binding domain-containing protein [Acinetobacter baretiae]MBF7682264.1 transporter substrate-binding domain-containing protein [Acinetobacter baretiae]MBF7685092.1 transporter substrate-binding domain-containing protein [Acinetobacter baretiae]
MKKYLTLCFFAFTATHLHAESQLQRIINKGTLDVCTTGDYKPYSFLNSDAKYEGIDISMAESLAKSLGVKANYIQSTWKTLTPDVVASKCDIAMGGISVTLARQRQVFFTQRIDVDGKVPFVRCTDAKKYQTIEQINKSSVRVIEPTGGTNEAFARQHLPNSHLTLSSDNLAIFQQLVDKKADVMITEASEAMYQKKHYPTLCAVNTDKPLQYGEKAYMLPTNDITWKLYVDQWLHLSKETGEYQKIINGWF